MAINTVKRIVNGQPFSIETGRMAKQADGAVVVRMGDTMVLVAVVAAQKKTDRDFFPLTVEYREKFYASGRIPGGFFKREGRPGERETLTSRLIDRPIRPLFDKHFMCETQVIATPISYDGVNAPDVISIVGASAALALSDIPFEDFVSGVRVGRIEGQFVVNPTVEQLETSDIDVIIAGTDTAVMMVEGACSEVSEEDMLAAVRFGHDEIKRLNALQRELVAAAGGKQKRVVEVPERLAELDQKIAKEFSDRIGQALFIAKKLDRQDALKAIQKDALAAYEVDYPEKGAYVALVLEEIEKKLMRDMILDKGKRLDGRGTTDIRPITCDVGVLPRAHGSALFTRGETQSLVDDDTRHHRGRADARHHRGRELEALHAALQLPGLQRGRSGPLRRSRSTRDRPRCVRGARAAPDDSAEDGVPVHDPHRVGDSRVERVELDGVGVRR